MSDAAVLAKTPEDLYDDYLANELYGERAAIRQYEGRQSRDEAGRLAVEDVQRTLGVLPSVSTSVSTKGNTHG
jgi:hypothetical protein